MMRSPRFRVIPAPGTDSPAGAWRSVSLTVEDDTPAAPATHPLTVATFLLPTDLAVELERQVRLMNDVLDVEQAQA